MRVSTALAPGLTAVSTEPALSTAEGTAAPRMLLYRRRSMARAAAQGTEWQPRSAPILGLRRPGGASWFPWSCWLRDIRSGFGWLALSLQRYNAPRFGGSDHRPVLRLGRREGRPVGGTMCGRPLRTQSHLSSVTHLRCSC